MPTLNNQRSPELGIIFLCSRIFWYCHASLSETAKILTLGTIFELIKIYCIAISLVLEFFGHLRAMNNEALVWLLYADNIYLLSNLFTVFI